MSIKKKLYLNFGLILTMVMVLFLVNMIAVRREHSAKAAAAKSLQMADATDALRSQMMKNRLYLSNYLLSGDTREVDKMNEGLKKLAELVQQAENLANSDQQRITLQKAGDLEHHWSDEFATPLIEKRKDVDSGNVTVAELQIFYLQKDASSWIRNTSSLLDEADTETRKVLDARRKSEDRKSTRLNS